MLIALRAVLLALFIAAPVGDQSPEADLQRLAADYATNPALTRPVTFGVRVSGDSWTVSAFPATEDDPARVMVTPGEPELAAYVYVTDSETFSRIASGDLQALTAMTRARGSDATPILVETVNGCKTDIAGRAAFLSATLHFFTTDQTWHTSSGIQVTSTRPGS